MTERVQARTPSVIACGDATFPKGTAFGGGGKVSGIAIRRPLGGAGERSETEGVLGQRRAPSQALPRQLSQRESQAVKRITKVLGAKRKLPVVLLALPLGELSPQVTERAHGVSPVAKVLGAMSKCPGAPEAPSQRELAKPSGFD